MKRYRIEYREAPPVCPMTPWVHRTIGGESWIDAEAYDPPRQPMVPGHFYVEFDGFTFTFASLAEIRVCMETLGKKVLPRTIDLTRDHGAGVGPNSHWLSRLPKEVKAWRYRERAIGILQKSTTDFQIKIG